MKMIHEHIEGQFLLGNVSKGVNANGGAYLSVELRDASGSIVGKKWDATAEDEQLFVVGNVVQVVGETNKYKEQLQLKILSAELVPLEQIDVEKFVKAPPVAIERFNAHVSSIKNEDCLKILKYMINKFGDKIYSYPAAVSIHHEYSSGLLMHSITMADLANYLCPIYDCDHDLMVTGCLLHDLGKIIELEGPIVYKYSTEGKLLGHISIMAAELRKAADELKIKSEIPLLLEHMVLSHHGQQEFGSPVMTSWATRIWLSSDATYKRSPLIIIN